MACTLFLKGFEENAGMAAPGWSLTGKIAAGAARCRFSSAASQDVLVKGARRTAPG